MDGGVCATEGIVATGIAAGLKPSGAPDLALVAARRAVAAAAVQTTNQVKAAPVKVTARHLADGQARAVLLNAGNANVCTGEPGMVVAESSAEAVAAALGCRPEDVLVCSTGVIGVPLPPQPLLGAIPGLVSSLSPTGGSLAAQAMLTTDTVAKQAAVDVSDGGGSCVVGGMAKGSGMIAPEMATMLGVLTTDAPLEGPALQAMLRRVSDRTFGRITVDGCQSTNDAVILLSTGEAPAPPSPAALEQGLSAVCSALAQALVRDGEGATRTLAVRVVGAPTEGDALGVARAIAASALVKTAIAGGDPNWGRILAAMGAGPVRFDPDQVDVAFGEVTVCRSGVVAGFDRDRAAAVLRGPEVPLTVDLHLGEAEATVLTCDLTHGYITINAEYTT
ncbi:MAG: bifunctional glutamate N-acetyltransferase/amino-acid acetyltransferase ArgJ [Nitriliruptorales bacterium]|nr:bifunctional glutamate N-acetyltransferase/amino-acid acetyltransferase ArgJ [Nitriliruptorales bacterium]